MSKIDQFHSPFFFFNPDTLWGRILGTAVQFVAKVSFSRDC